MKVFHFLIVLMGFILLEFSLFEYIDRPLCLYVRSLDSTSPHFIDVFRFYTDYAKGVWYLWPSGMGVLVISIVLRTVSLSQDLHRKLTVIGQKLLFFFSSLAFSGLITDLIKPILARARPIEWTEHHIYGFTFFSFHSRLNSMPSGHSTTAFALATALSLLWPRQTIIWVLLGLILASARVMVNAHYLSDVIAGAAVGSLTTLVIYRFFRSTRIIPIVDSIFPIDRPL